MTNISVDMQKSNIGILKEKFVYIDIIRDNQETSYLDLCFLQKVVDQV